MSTEWKVQSNPVGGIMMYIPSRIIDPNQPEHSGNIEHHGTYTKDRAEAQRIVDELNGVQPEAAGIVETPEFDRSKLRGRIVEKFGTAKAFAHAIGKTEQTVTAKMTGKSGLSQDDICNWCNTLDLTIDDIGPYFFAPKLSKL